MEDDKLLTSRSVSSFECADRAPWEVGGGRRAAKCDSQVLQNDFVAVTHEAHCR